MIKNSSHEFLWNIHNTFIMNSLWWYWISILNFVMEFKSNEYKTKTKLTKSPLWSMAEKPAGIGSIIVLKLRLWKASFLKIKLYSLFPLKVLLCYYKITENNVIPHLSTYRTESTECISKLKVLSWNPNVSLEAQTRKYNHEEWHENWA